MFGLRKMQMKPKEATVKDWVRMLLASIKENPDRPGLLDTPDRVTRAWTHWTQGYQQTPKTFMKSFEDGAQDVDQMVLVSNIPIFSHCEHHLAPFWGLAHIAYIPSSKVLGLSKFARISDVYARRLQVQERLTNQIAEALHEGALQPVGVGVRLECRHMCMESRGVASRGTVTATTALRGAIKTEPDARNEFYHLVSDTRSKESL